MWGFDQTEDAYQQAYTDNEPNEAKLSHELIGGAAAFGGMKAWEDHQRKQGIQVSHAFAKEALMGAVGFELDRLVETKGMDEYESIQARRHAERSAEKMYDDHYINNQGADQYDPNQYDRPEQFNRY